MAKDDAKKAHDLAEQALDKAADGDTSTGKRLVEEARKLDPKAVDEVAREVEEDRTKAGKA